MIWAREVVLCLIPAFCLATPDSESGLALNDHDLLVTTQAGLRRGGSALKAGAQLQQKTLLKSLVKMHS